MATVRNVTASSRIMLPAYFMLSLCAGLSYLLMGPQRTATPAFDVVKAVRPLWFWAILFLILAALKLAALIADRRELMILALCYGLAIWCTWGVGFTLSLWSIPDPWWHIVTHLDLTGWPSQWSIRSGWALKPTVSFIPPLLWFFICVCHVASLRSLTADMKGRPA